MSKSISACCIKKQVPYSSCVIAMQRSFAEYHIAAVKAAA